MSNEKVREGKYSWNRNAAHHRIAITRFAAFALIYSCMVGGIILLGMGAWSDNSKEYVVATAFTVLTAIVVSFCAFLWMMTTMYVWVNQEGMVSPTPPKERVIEIPYYQTDKGWIAGKPVRRVGGEVSTVVDTFKGK